MISRREFVLGASAAMGIVGAVHPLHSWGAGESPAIPAKDGMIVRSLRFLDLEMPVEYANSLITPVEHFFVRNHMHEPSTVDATARSRSGSSSVPLLVACWITWATNFCCRCIRPRSALGST